MADKSKIEWTDATWNPIRGCSVVSEGCRNCYAMAHAARFSGKGQAYEGLAYRNGSGAHWAGKVRLIERHLEDPLRWKRPRRIFVNSMCDLFHESIPDEWIDKIFAVMAKAKRHSFQILTKRPHRMYDYISRSAFLTNAPLKNVWLGVSIEDRESMLKRVPLLLKTPAAVKWLSVEPLLGPIANYEVFSTFFYSGFLEPPQDDVISWVVVGGESGAGARPMHPDWVRTIRDQCVAAGVPFFFKQWGEWDGGGLFGNGCDDPCGRCVAVMPDGSLTGTDWEAGPHLKGSEIIHRIGKKAAGRLLDGREWNEYPDIAMGSA
jgi:protein gp37